LYCRFYGGGVDGIIARRKVIWSSAHGISKLLFEFVEKLVIRLLIIFSSSSETILLATSIKIAVHVVQIIPIGRKEGEGKGDRSAVPVAEHLGIGVSDLRFLLFSR
jgi:hypothetical protein